MSVCPPSSGVVTFELFEELQCGLQGRHDGATDEVQIVEALPALK